MIQKTAKLLLILAVAILVSGAVYMVLVHHAYAIGGCFAAAAILLTLCFVK